MASYGDMIDRIKFELDRSVSSEDEYIRKAIISAIDTYKTERFRWNEKRLTFSTSSGNDSYASNFQRVDNVTVHDIGDVVQVDWVMVQPSGTTDRQYDLRRLDGKAIEALSANATSGQPYYWDLNSDAIRIYPTPDAAHDIQFQALVDVNSLVYNSTTSGGTTNPWFNEAEEMIRARALSNCYTYWLKEYKRGQLFMQIADQEFRRHRSNYERLTTTGKGITPWYGAFDLDRGVTFER